MQLYLDCQLLQLFAIISKEHALAWRSPSPAPTPTELANDVYPICPPTPWWGTALNPFTVCCYYRIRGGHYPPPQHFYQTLWRCPNVRHLGWYLRELGFFSWMTSMVRGTTTVTRRKRVWRISSRWLTSKWRDRLLASSKLRHVYCAPPPLLPERGLFFVFLTVVCRRSWDRASHVHNNGQLTR